MPFVSPLVTYTAYFLAPIASAILFGITTLQVYLYFRLYWHDHAFFKLWVTVIWVLDALTLALEIHAAYFYLVINSGNVFALETVVWSLRIQGILGLFICPVVQSMYVFKLWRLYHDKKAVPLVLTFAMALSWASGMVSVSQVNRARNVLFVPEDYKIILGTSFAAAAAMDILNTIALCYALYKPRRSLSCTGSLVQNIVLWTIGTGVLTSIFATVGCITFILSPLHPAWVSVAMVMYKVYANCCLAMLNVRRHLRSSLPETILHTLKSSRSHGDHAMRTSHLPRQSMQPIHWTSDYGGPSLCGSGDVADKITHSAIRTSHQSYELRAHALDMA